MAIADIAGLQPHIRAGRLRGLAVAGPQPRALMPELPPISATLPGVDDSALHGVFAPARTPPEIVDRLHRALSPAR
jgi:tripartite-type tricarboxylate transporter receptor subunit TctC